MKQPKFDHLNNDPFITPEGYFDQLEGRIRQRVSGTEPTHPWYQTALRLTPLAVGILLIGWFLMPSPDPASETAESILAEISAEEIARYMEVHNALAAEDVLLPAEDEALLIDVFSTDTL